MKNKSCNWWCVGLLMCSALGSFAVQARPATPVNVMVAMISDMAPTGWVSGSVISNNDAQIAAQAGGRLIAVADVGQRVHKGELIGKIDDTMIQLQVNELTASVASSKRNYDFLIGEVERKKSLTQRNLAAQTDLDQMINDRDIGKTRWAEQQSRLEQTRKMLTYTSIHAPFDGVVTQRLSKLVEVVSSGTKIIQLVETVNLEVTAQVPLVNYPYLHIGDELTIKSALGSIQAKIRVVVPVANVRSHLMELRLTLAETAWPVGLDVRVAVPNAPRASVLVVHRDAIVLRRGGNAVFRINDENKAERVAVELGIASGAYIAVIGEVKAGDKIVIRGAERLQPGQAVAIKDNNDALVSL